MKPSILVAHALAVFAVLPAPASHAQPADVSIVEVFYDAANADDELEWVELWNAGDVPVDLSSWSLGWGGSTWVAGQLALAGVIDPGARFVVGGPVASPDNAEPAFDLAADFDPDLQNAGSTADGVALFDVPAGDVTEERLPVSVVLYGGENTSGLVGADGAIAGVDVADAPAGSSIERGADGIWRAQPAPTPSAPPRPVAEPPGVALAGALATLALGATWRRSPSATSLSPLACSSLRGKPAPSSGRSSRGKATVSSYPTTPSATSRSISSGARPRISPSTMSSSSPSSGPESSKPPGLAESRCAERS
jgi:hypothetical protein